MEYGSLVRELYEGGRTLARRTSRNAYMIGTIAAATLACSCDGPMEPKNQKPEVSAQYAPKPTYLDDTLRVNTTYKDPENDPMTAEEVRHTKNGVPVSQFDNQRSVPLAGITQAGDRWIVRYRAKDGEWSDWAADTTDVRDPNLTIDGRYVFFADSTPASNQVIRLRYGPTGETKLDTTDTNGRFSMNFDRRKIANPNAKSEIFAYGNATPLGGRRFHDYLDSLDIASDRNSSLGNMIMITYYVSPSGKIAFPRWKRMTGNDGTGANTLHECWQTYPAMYFIDASNPLARDWPTIIRNSFDGPTGWNTIVGRVGEEVLSIPLIGVTYEYFEGSGPNEYIIDEWANPPQNTIPKRGRIRLQSGGANVRSAGHEEGHINLCLWREDWDVEFESLNDESIMGSAPNTTETDFHYGLYSLRIPQLYNVRRHLDTSIRF